MTPEEIERMKRTPGLHLVVGSDPTLLLVASVDGKLYAMVADNELNDEGWMPHTSYGGCLLQGQVSKIDDAVPQSKKH